MKIRIHTPNFQHKVLSNAETIEGVSYLKICWIGLIFGKMSI